MEFFFSFFGELNVTRVDLSGISDAIYSHREEGSEYKGAKAHFRMDDSGVLNLDTVRKILCYNWFLTLFLSQADVTFEKLVKEDEKTESSSTFKSIFAFFS